MNSASNSILRRIRAKQRGWVFTPKSFIDLAPRNTVGITLHRLLNKGIIRKIAHGIYDFPAIHPKLGILAADPDSLAKAIASKTGDVIQSSGAKLANQLGLDTQVPSQASYLTSGNSKRKKVGNYPITLQHSRFLSNTTLDINALNVITAIHHLGKNNITDNIIKKCKNILSKKDKSQLKKNLAKLPSWMVPFIQQIIGT